MQAQFTPGKGSRITKAQCAVIVSEFDKITESGSKLSPESVVAAATEKGSPLHSFFDWNQKEAAEKWRLAQAAQLIRSVDVRIEISPMKPPIQTRAYVSFRDDEGYFSITSVMADDRSRGHLLEQAKQEMRAFMSKYQILDELAGVFAVMKKSA